MKQLKQIKQIQPKQKSNIFNTNKIHLNNKYIRNDKELLALLKFILAIRKRKRYNKSKLFNKYNNDTKIIDNIDISKSTPNLYNVLPINHNINQYRMIENELNNMRNQINHNNIKNALPQIENKHETPINWTHYNTEPYELIKKVAADRDPIAAKKLVDVVPEFKNMMEDLAELGASSAKDYIKGLEKDIYNLNEKRTDLEDNNNKLNYEIETMQTKLEDINNNKTFLENKVDELNDNINDLSTSNDNFRSENNRLINSIDKYKSDIDGLEKLYQSTKSNLDKIILDEQDMKNKIIQMDDVINAKHKEIELLNELKDQAESKADEEYHIRRQAEEGLREISKVKKQLAKENVNINRSLRLEKINNMTRPQLLKELKLQDTKKPYISSDQLKSMLIEKENLNTVLATPPSTPDIDKYINNDVLDYV